MKIPAVKQICQSYDLEELRAAEAALLEERQPAIQIPGDDEGEQLTHVMAAIWIKEEMGNSGCDLNLAVRSYSQRVRRSIS